MQSWPAGRSLPKVSTYFHLHQLHRDNLDQVASLETRVKYDKGLVDATGGDLEVAQFLVVFIIAAVIVLKMSSSYLKARQFISRAVEHAKTRLHMLPIQVDYGDYDVFSRPGGSIHILGRLRHSVSQCHFRIWTKSDF